MLRFTHMAIDSVLHIVFGGVITVFLFSNKVRGIYVLLSLIFLAFTKELYDHFVIVGHCFPACMDEHISDFFFSLLFFFCYIPVLALTQKRSPVLSLKHYIIIWISVTSLHFAFKFYRYQQNHNNKFLSHIAVCSAK